MRDSHLVQADRKLNIQSTMTLNDYRKLTMHSTLTLNDYPLASASQGLELEVCITTPRVLFSSKPCKICNWSGLDLEICLEH